MPVDRLTHIRDNWQEKGNGPRGRDVDFLLGLAEKTEKVRPLSGAERAMLYAQEDVVERARRLSRDLGLTLEKYDAARRAALPATESAQPEDAK